MSGKLQNDNIYTIAKRNVEGQDMLYQSLKLTNGIWILAELRIQPGNPNYTVKHPPNLNSPNSELRSHSLFLSVEVWSVKQKALYISTLPSLEYQANKHFCVL